MVGVLYVAGDGLSVNDTKLILFLDGEDKIVLATGRLFFLLVLASS